MKITDWVKKENIKMTIAADHGGFEMKNFLIEKLSGKNIEIIDCGPYEFDPADNYPDFAGKASKIVAVGEAD